METLLSAPHHRGMEAITVRRATLADADKVRYRVYRTPGDFIAVIAESALMAVKVSGISQPYKIVRDLPTEGIAVEAQRMAKLPNPEGVTLPTRRLVEQTLRTTEMPEARPEGSQGRFVAMPLADLRSPNGMRARILPAEFLFEIIEEHARSVPPTPEHAAEVRPLSEEEAILSAPVAFSREEEIVTASLSETIEERVIRMADELLPPATPRGEVSQPVSDAQKLSSDDVAKLLSDDDAV